MKLTPIAIGCLTITCLFAAPRARAQAAHDPWIDKAFREVAGRAPQGAEWNVANYGHGHWSSYEDLADKVRVRVTGQGVAYVFIEPQQAVQQGHIGWAFMLDDGSYCYGSTENPMKGMANLAQGVRAVVDTLTIDPGKDNGYWCGYCDQLSDLMSDMKRAGNDHTPSAKYPYGFRGNGYWHYKKTYVQARNVNAARAAGEHDRTTGFKGLGWNCLDQTYAVLEAYGVDKNTVMPWKQTHLSPNYWFNDFGGWDPHSGQYSKGNNTSGYPL